MSKPSNYYVIVKRDFTNTKTAVAVQPAFTDRRNALEAMEDYTFGCVAEADGMEYAKRCLIDESMHMSFVAKQFEAHESERSAKFLEASLKERETALMEKGFARLDNGKFNPNEGYVLSEKRFLRKVATFPKKHYVTRDVESSTDRLTVWRKYDVERVVPGLMYGTKSVTETVCDKQFSVEVIAIPSAVLQMQHQPPNVTYKSEWYQTLCLPKNVSEDQYIEQGRKDLAKDFCACLEDLVTFTVLSQRFADEEDVGVYEDAAPLNLPRIRYNHPYEFTHLPFATKYSPDPQPEEQPEQKETPDVDSKDNIE